MRVCVCACVCVCVCVCVQELKTLLKPEYYPYFSRYLVIKRAALEQNFHKLYSQFLDAVSVDDLNRAVVDCTYENVRLLLANDKVLHSSSERSLLKNLGAWLGLLTIAKKRPVLARRLDLKELILEGYGHGRLIAVIPFVCKILER